jgi:hypothetical protein
MKITQKSLEHFKNPDIGLKNAPNIFQKNPQICFLGGKSPKLATLSSKTGFPLPG